MSGFPISLSKGVTPSPCIRQGTGILLYKAGTAFPSIRKGPGFFLYKEGITIPPLAARVIVRLDFYPACADIRYEHLCVAKGFKEP